MPINILIIEDVDNRITSLGNAIKNVANNKEINIYPNNDMDDFRKNMTKAASESDAILTDWVKNNLVNYLDDNDIDLIILDFYLYGEEENDTNRIDKTSGYTILKELRNHHILENIPIFANSILNKNIYNTNDSILSTLAGIIEKKPTQDDYEDFFDDNKFILNRMLLLAEGYKKEKIKSDIVVICALASELKAIRNLNLDWQEFKYDKKIFYKGKLGKFKVVATSENKMGMPEAAALTTRAIDIFNPKYVVMTGIAAGIDPNKQKFLDLLIPERIFNWQSGKYKVKKIKNDKEQGNNDIKEKMQEKDLHIFDKDHRSYSTYFKNRNDINLKKDDISMKILEECEREDFKITNLPTIFSEGMVSGSAVVADKDIVNEKIDERKIYGIDMEAYGVAFACNNHPKEPKAIIIKAITDFADEDKNDDAQPAGMHLSAVAFKVIFEELING